MKWFAVIAVLVVGMLLYSPVSQSFNRVFYTEKEEITSDRVLYPYDSGTVKVDRYKDLNEVHLKYAKTKGINGFKTEKSFFDSVEKLVKDGKLVKIEENKNYALKKLTHSHPYLTPEAAKLLNDIGERFRKKLDNKGLDQCYFQVSSLMRTQESQKKLSRSNSNASSNSSHLYGTTFDIRYNKVVKKPNISKRIEVVDGPAIKLLSETIGELRKEGRCVVVTERNEACFHITVRE